jgi:hypothetical protein
MATRDKLVSIPYKGDDFPQNLAKRLWFPMLAMGLMAVAVGLVGGSVAGVSFGDFFGGGGFDDLGTAEATKEWALGTTFLGMGFILSSVTMVLVNILWTLRDTGRDVQLSAGAREVTQLKKPLTGHLVPHVMMMGLFIVMAGFVIAIVRANLIGGIDPQGLADPSVLSAADLADLGTSQAIDGWIAPLKFTGLATIFASIVLALRTIIKGIRFQAQRVEELADERRIGAA